MTSNGASAPPAPVEDHRPEAEFSEPVEETTAELKAEPQMTVQSMDYWREMTQRQVARLASEIKTLEAEYQSKLGPLRRDLSVLQAALGGVSAKLQVGRTKFGQGDPSQPKNQGTDITDQQRELVKQLVVLGKDTTAIRQALPEVKSGQVYSAVYSAKQQLIKEAKPR